MLHAAHDDLDVRAVLKGVGFATAHGDVDERSSWSTLAGRSVARLAARVERILRLGAVRDELRVEHLQIHVAEDIGGKMGTSGLRQRLLDPSTLLLIKVWDDDPRGSLLPLLRRARR